MDSFEFAAQRLQRDQSNLKGRRKVELSAQAVREAALRKKRQQELADQRTVKVQRRAALESFMRQCERSLGVKPLSASAEGSGQLLLKATSIYGEGDKIALPPSVLETLTNETMMSSNHLSEQQQQQQPWTFRIGILNPEYSFPASPILETLPLPTTDDSEELDDEIDDGGGSGEFHQQHQQHHQHSTTKAAAYLDELQHKYLSYTHGTVVEFTQDEGCVGLPEPIARALLQPRKSSSQAEAGGTTIETTRTVDKAAATAAAEDDDANMQVDGDDSEKTPGHLAWGAFDVPLAGIEITLLQLPKGRTAKLRPTVVAVQNGFYNLKDIKMVLEQALMRTRATLTVNDVIHTWHRGTKFDLTVTAVTPATYNAVSCINTDIEIDFDEQLPTDAATFSASSLLSHTTNDASVPLGGRRLNEPPSLVPSSSATTSTFQALAFVPKAIDLVPEPPEEQHEGVVTVQIRAANGARGQRRFHVRTSTVKDLFAFATTLLMNGGNFQLVTRFPRRVLTLDGNGGSGGASAMTLQEAGIEAGQEMFMVEML